MARAYAPKNLATDFHRQTRTFTRNSSSTLNHSSHPLVISILTPKTPSHSIEEGSVPVRESPWQKKIPSEECPK